MSHYSHKSILDAKFDADRSSSFGKITSQTFPQKKGNESSNSAIYPRKTGLTLKKLVLMSRIVLLDLKLTPIVNFSNLQAEENFYPHCQFQQFASRRKFLIDSCEFALRASEAPGPDSQG